MIRRLAKLNLEVLSLKRMWTLAMNVKQLRQVQLTNMALWGTAIFLPIVARAFSSKDPKIFDVLMPMFQFLLAGGSSWMFGALLKSNNSSPQNETDAK